MGYITLLDCCAFSHLSLYMCRSTLIKTAYLKFSVSIIQGYRQLRDTVRACKLTVFVDIHNTNKEF